MNRTTAFFMLPVITGALAAFAAGAEPPPGVPDAFMKQLTAGINAHDLASLRSITVPATLTCMTPGTADYYSWWLWKDGSKRNLIPEHYKAQLAAPLDIATFEGVPKDDTLLHWPLQPDAGLNVTYSPAPKVSVRRSFEIMLKDGKAQLVMDCPTPLGLEKFRKMARVDAERKKKLARLWKSMDAAEQEAFTTMVAQGLKNDAMTGAERKFQLNPDESLAFVDMITYGNTP